MSDDFKGFIHYLQSIWGLLSGITVFFPISNYFIEVIPVPWNKDRHLFIASLMSMFVIFFLYSIRKRLIYSKYMPQLISLLSFLSGMYFLWDYLNWSSKYGTLWPLPFEHNYLFIYGLIFGLFTSSFTALALVEYDRTFNQT